MIIPANDTFADVVHARKTVTFANDSGTVNVFTVTGRVLIERVVAYCTVSLTETGLVTGIEFGGATDPNALIVSADPAAIVAGTFWYDATPTSGIVQMQAIQQQAMTDEDLILTITGGTDIATGTIIFDVWYRPITDGGKLAAA